MEALGAGRLSQEQARTLYAYGPEAVVFVVLLLCKQLAELCVQMSGKLCKLRRPTGVLCQQPTPSWVPKRHPTRTRGPAHPRP